MKQNIVLVGAPVEEGTGRRGCLMGPDAYRTAGLATTLEALGHHVRDDGNLQPETVDDIRPPNGIVKNFGAYAGWTRSLFNKASELGTGDSFPIYLGGDHSLAAGTVAGQAKAAAEKGRPLFVLWLDAHSDFHTLESTDSGNLHGTPLAFACGLPGFDAVLGAPLSHPVSADRVEIMGVRSIDEAERDFLVRHGAGVSDMRRIDEEGIGKLLHPFLERVRAENGLLHVSLDVDFLDPEIAPGTGTAVRGGPTYREAQLCMEMIADTGRLASLDIVELNPALDIRNQTAELVVDLVESLFGKSTLINR